MSGYPTLMEEIDKVFNNSVIKIRSKLIFILILAGLIPFLIIGVISLNVSRNSLSNQVFSQLEGLRDNKKNQIIRYFDKSIADITVLANSSHIITALDAFSSTFVDGGLDKNLYNYYESLEYGDSFTKFINEYGYYDVMLITLEGNIVYSLKKEDDLSKNVLSGSLKDTLLGQNFNRALESVVITDFKLYPVSDYRPIAFLLAPIKFFNDTEGVLVLKLSTSVINEIMQERSGLSETSEVYMIGPDKLMRSDSYLDSKYHSVKASMTNPELGLIETFAGNQALLGNTGRGIIKNYQGADVLSAYVPISYQSLKYALVAEVEESEAFKEVNNFRNIFIIIGIILTLLIVIISILIADRFTNPITKLTNVSIQIASGELDHDINIKSSDEMGILAHSFDIMRHSIKTQITNLDLEIEQRKSAEEELKKHRDNLEEVVTKRTADLKKATMVAKEADRAKSDFLANMSHEIRTPMNAIIGLDNLLSKTDMSSKQRDYVDKIGSSARNLLGIINDILDFSKIEAGKLEIEKTDFRLSDVMNSLSGMIGDKAADKGIELIFRQDKNIPFNLIGDPLRLGQVLLNLTNNAVKFTEKGEVLVSSELLSSDSKEVLIKFEIMDTGIGLKEYQAAKLFSSFSQADSTITRKYGGTGLGLSISKKLCELMGGDIGVESIFGKGSTFYFTIKLGIGEKIKKEEQLSPSDLEGLKVLVVDDNQTTREVLCSYLKDFSFNSKAVSSGELALRELTQSKAITGKDYDLVLMDYLMDGINGLETSRRINSELENVDIPQIIMVTGISREEIVKQSKESGIKGFINKPVSPSMLLDSIMEAFGRDSKLNKRMNRHSSIKPGGFEDIRGAKLLIVEDNSINQQVAKETLESEGFYVEIAENGKVGLKKVEKNNSFDLVLMDLQMPIMDGYESTRSIRKIYSYDQLPIVAMTADAMTGVRDNVIKSGMNDYITKPINPGDLWRTLIKWIKADKRDLPKNYLDQNIKEDLNLTVPEIPKIDTEDGLIRVGGNRRLYLNLLIQLRDEYVNTVLDIKNTLENNNLKDAIRMAHTLKSVAGNIGAGSVQIESERLETALKENQNPKNIIQNLEIELKDIIKFLREANLSDNSKEKTKKNIDSDKLNNMLVQLKAALTKRKAKVAKDIVIELENYNIPEKLTYNLKELSVKVKQYSFKNAIELTDKLLKQI